MKFSQVNSHLLACYLSRADSEVAKSHDQRRFHNFLSKQCVTLFNLANSKLEDVYKKIENGTITFHQLSEIVFKEDDLSQLLAARYCDKDKVRQILKERFNEYTLLLKRKERLGLLCQHVHVPVKGKTINSQGF